MRRYLHSSNPDKQRKIDNFLEKWDGSYGYVGFCIGQGDGGGLVRAALRDAMDQAIAYVDRKWPFSSTSEERREIAYELLERILRVEVGVFYGLVEATDE